MSGSSTGQILGYVVGAVVGYFTGGTGFYPTLAAMGMGASVGGAIGGAIDPPKGPLLVGPRLNDLSVQTATYGAVIPRVYGTVALMGNIFWLENNKIKEKKKTESQGKGGGGGTQTKTYSYYGTFAVGLCEGPIDGVRRIWVGSKLIYDAGSDDISTIIASNEAATKFTVHNGSDTQIPDDRMQATLGAANTPAYLGLAYIVLKDYPLKDHGNSLLGAQVKVEIVKNGSIAGLSNIDNYSITNTNWLNAVFTTGYSYIEPFIYIAYPLNDTRIAPTPLVEVRRYNVITGDVDYFSTINVTGAVWGAAPGKSDSTTFGIKDNNPGVCSTQVYDDATVSSPTFKYSIRGGYYYGIAANGLLLRYSIAQGDFGGALSNRQTFSPYITPNTSTASNMWACETTDDYVYYGYRDASLNRVVAKFDRITLEHVISNSSIPTFTGLSIIADDEIYYTNSGNLYLTTDFFSSSTLLGASPSPSTTEFPWNVFSISPGLIAVASQITSDFTINIYRLVGPISQTRPTLESIVRAELLSSRVIAAGDMETTLLAQEVRGYRVSSVAAIRSGIEPLQGAWPFDVLQAGYKIKFKPRGSAVVATIPAIDLDAREAGKGGGVSITSSREMDSILPQRVVLRHIDFNREYDQGEQYAERLNTTAVNIQTVEMPIVMTGGEAAANAEMLLYLYWLERHDVSFSLPPTYGLLEPGDVLTVNAASATYELRLTSINYLPDGRLECSAKYNSAAVYLPTALGEEGQSTGAVLTLDGSTDFELLDIPLLLDATDTPGFPVAMTGYLAGWPGGILYRTDDSGQTWTDLESFVAPGCTMGRAGAAIGAGRTDLIDKASALTVSLTSGELSSISEAAMLGGANHFAYGAHGRWEIIAAQNCTQQGDGSYILTDLLRGRFGSEHACASHATGDSIVLLDSSRLAFVTANLNTIGTSRTYRGVTAGKDISTGGEKTLAYTGVNLECLSPIYLNGNRHPSTNDWSLEWIRRTRVGGEWRDYVDATLGETTQAYEVEIYSSAAYTTLKRTFTGLATPATSYTSAQQVTDFGSNQATLYVKVYQLSANVGRGYPLTTSITR